MREECLGVDMEEAAGLEPPDPALHSPVMFLSGILTLWEREVLRDTGLRYQPFVQEKWNIPDVPAAFWGNEELGKASSEWRQKIGGEMSTAPSA